MWCKQRHDKHLHMGACPLGTCPLRIQASCRKEAQPRPCERPWSIRANLGIAASGGSQLEAALQWPQLYSKEQKILTAKPSQPTDLWNIIIHCYFKPLNFGWPVYVPIDNGYMISFLPSFRTLDRPKKACICKMHLGVHHSQPLFSLGRDCASPQMPSFSRCKYQGLEQVITCSESLKFPYSASNAPSIKRPHNIFSFQGNFKPK